MNLAYLPWIVDGVRKASIGAFGFKKRMDNAWKTHESKLNIYNTGKYTLCYNA